MPSAKGTWEQQSMHCWHARHHQFEQLFSIDSLSTPQRVQQLQSTGGHTATRTNPAGGLSRSCFGILGAQAAGTAMRETIKLSGATLTPFLTCSSILIKPMCLGGWGWIPRHSSNTQTPWDPQVPLLLHVKPLCKPSHSPYAWLVSVHLLPLSLITPRVSYNSLNSSFCKADLHPSYNLRRTHNFLTVPLTSCRHHKEHCTFSTQM